MLLPSALSCDSSQPSLPKPRFQNALFASPPLSPPGGSSHPAINNLYSTCRALQNMLTTPNQLPSPPTTHAEMSSHLSSSPFKLRLRARKTGENESSTAMGMVPRKKITKRAHAPPRGINKRRRAADDELTREMEEREEGETENEDGLDANDGPSTPKRRRVAPEVLPLGLERSDFHSLLGDAEAGEKVVESVEGTEEGGEVWSTEEDRLLVELVLEKLKLTKSDWQDCARSLGKDRGSVGRRWKSLMAGGEVGLKSRPRRSKIHGTWR